MSCKWLVALTLVLSACSARHEQINLVLQTRPDRPTSIEEIVADVAHQAGMEVTKQTLQFGEATSTSVFLIHDYSVSVVVQKTLENCPGPEVSFDPCFAASDYKVSIYRSSVFPARRRINLLAKLVISEAQKRGGRAYVDRDAVNDA